MSNCSQASVSKLDGPLGRLGEAFLPVVQLSRRQGSISVDGLRSFLAVLGDDDVGLFVSLGGFTKDADSEARTQEKRKVILLDA